MLKWRYVQCCINDTLQHKIGLSWLCNGDDVDNQKLHKWTMVSPVLPTEEAHHCGADALFSVFFLLACSYSFFALTNLMCTVRIYSQLPCVPSIVMKNLKNVQPIVCVCARVWVFVCVCVSFQALWSLFWCSVFHFRSLCLVVITSSTHKAATFT